MKNKIHLDFASNPEMAEFFSQKKSGDKCTFEVTMQVDRVNGESAEGTIEKIAYESQGQEKEATPEPEKPMMMEIKAGKGRKKQMPAMMEDAY